MTKTILVVGTYDTKDDELNYICSCIKGQGGKVLTMDVSVLGDPSAPTDITKHDVAAAAGSSIQQAIDADDENAAMQIMAAGCATLTAQRFARGDFDGVVVLGGTMATDLALDCTNALPLGVPKYIVSTVSFSPLIPVDRLSADTQMILWAGGLYGLNDICKSSLSQAAGAVLGAARAVETPQKKRPVIGMTSLGSSCLKYMKLLKKPLEDRGFSVAVFHATGMGGMAFESLAAEGFFECVFDFAVPELGNLLAGSAVHAGRSRMLAAGKAGIPQIVAPGCSDLVDFPAWQDIPQRFADRPFHAHNRLIASASLDGPERAELAREMIERLSRSTGPVHLILPERGVEEWDREGDDLHDPQALMEMYAAFDQLKRAPVEVSRVDAHINDAAFSDKALEILDGWIASGLVRRSV